MHPPISSRSTGAQHCDHTWWHLDNGSVLSSPRTIPRDGLARSCGIRR